MKKLLEPDYSSPKYTFVALFNDGVVTRMTTHCENGKLSLGRGLALSVAAYESRAGTTPPAIVAAKFVEPGYTDTVIKGYDAKALGERANQGRPQMSAFSDRIRDQKNKGMYKVADLEGGKELTHIISYLLEEVEMFGKTVDILNFSDTARQL